MTPPRQAPTFASYLRGVPAIHRRYLASFRSARIPHRFTDVLVIGSGVAGLSAALAASREERLDILVLAKRSLDESATRWAQGGVAAVVSPERTADTVACHIEDSIAGAAGLADETAVRVAAEEGVERVRELIALGAQFDVDEAGELRFTREGGHSRPRILHRGDTTGQEIERTLLAAVSARPNALLLPDTFAIDILTADGRAAGALVWSANGEIEAIWARQTILATGGAGRLYRETTNPALATGDGLAMSFRAGAALQDLEFVQFHPTTLYLAGAERFLITEAIRGEGGVLRDSKGEAFMQRFHPLADLAPRDVVSRAILRVMRESGENKVWLDLSAIPEERIRERFPRIREMLAGFGIEIPRHPIPVRPSAHYTIGGVATDLHGQTSVPGLLAAGEVACTGFHGANRLGSNSLLEGLVFGRRAGLRAAERSSEVPPPRSAPLREAEEGSRDASARNAGLSGAGASAAPPPVRTSAPASALEAGYGDLPGRTLNLDDLLVSLKSLMWYRVGVERSGEGLASALEQLRAWMAYPMSTDFRDPRSWSLQNMLQSAYLITLSALRREESRGVHHRSDFPERDDERWKRHLTIARTDFPE
jgi:L-aspartate oxidase